jgi:CheY-like chemotaxis protein
VGGEKEAGAAASRGLVPKVILLVEDDPDVRELAGLILSDLGYEVLEAGDGLAGLALLETFQEIDLLFTDIVMPGLDGVTLAERAKEVRPDLPVVYATGFADRVRDIKQAHLEGPLLQKPFRRRELAGVIERAFAAAERRPDPGNL